MDLFEFSDVKALLGLDKASMTDYPDLQLIADMVTSRIEEYLGKKFEQEKRTVFTEILTPTRMVALEALPVKSIASLTHAGADISVYNVTHYGLKLASKIGEGTLSCTYTGGIEDVPEWLKRAAIYQTCYEFQNKDHVGASFVSTEGGSVSRPELSLLKDVRLILDPHRHPLTRFF